MKNLIASVVTAFIGEFKTDDPAYLDSKEEKTIEDKVKEFNDPPAPNQQGVFDQHNTTGEDPGSGTGSYP